MLGAFLGARVQLSTGDHGQGGVYTHAGREAALAFLRGHGLLATRRPSKAVAAAGEAAVEGAKAALAIQVGDFPPSRWTEWRDNRRTLRLAPRCEQK